jgi:hypothetical protein
MLHRVTVSRALKVFDGHNDVLLADRSFAERSSEGHPVAESGGVVGVCFH